MEWNGNGSCYKNKYHKDAHVKHVNVILSHDILKHKKIMYVGDVAMVFLFIPFFFLRVEKPYVQNIFTTSRHFNFF